MTASVSLTLSPSSRARSGYNTSATLHAQCGFSNVCASPKACTRADTTCPAFAMPAHRPNEELSLMSVGASTMAAKSSKVSPPEPMTTSADGYHARSVSRSASSLARHGGNRPSPVHTACARGPRSWLATPTIMMRPVTWQLPRQRERREQSQRRARVCRRTCHVARQPCVQAERGGAVLAVPEPDVLGASVLDDHVLRPEARQLPGGAAQAQAARVSARARTCD